MIIFRDDYLFEDDQESPLLGMAAPQLDLTAVKNENVDPYQFQSNDSPKSPNGHIYGNNNHQSQQQQQAMINNGQYNNVPPNPQNWQFEWHSSPRAQV